MNGTASDNRSLDRIVLLYRNFNGMTVRSVNAVCSAGCTTWSDTPSLPTGTYDLLATVYEAAANTATFGRVNFVVIGL